MEEVESFRSDEWKAKCEEYSLEYKKKKMVFVNNRKPDEDVWKRINENVTE